ncbi:MAG TPA: M48 family metallopeptidase [Candidatus Saccharimonadales bacterium]|nr:M48 family metallopeptidase [Candidatus Saccharimonadales bacterium]
MQLANIIAWFVVGLILARLMAELWLAALNRRHVLAHANEIPVAFREIIDKPSYKKSIEYTLAKGRFGHIEDIYSAAVLLIFLFSGVLPRAFQLFSHGLDPSAWAMAAFLFTVGFAMSLLSLPFDLFSQFRLEEKFGFNTTTQKIWWADRLKGLLLALVLGYPLLVLILKIVQWTGAWWWLWAWGAVLAFQLLMSILAPVLILPLFNKFTPLPEGSLRERLLDLARRTEFRAKSIQLMDGSKRSRHSNAFFTGFGRFRKIVLFDTLVQQLSEPELEAVLAHEIGHYKKKHIPKMLISSAVTSLVGFYLVSILAQQDWFYRAFGFESGNIAPALLLFGLLAGAVTFWLSPLVHWWLRRYEYQADAFAARVMNEAQSLIGALRKLNEKNLSNLTPHPLYSRFYYSHPTLLEREGALMKNLD